jgi:transglutaminase-like putative cysteine protease
MTDYLTQTTLLRLLAVLALVIGPHLARLPAWEGLLLVAVLGWRALISLRQWRLPAPWLRSVIAFACFAAVYASFRSISGMSAGTALLCVMAGLKLLEMRARRDVMIVVLLMYFILVTHFLFSQEIWTVVYLAFSAVSITALLMDCNHPGEALPTRVLLRAGGIMVAQALPLMLVFFVLFPRIPGPLWSLPTDTGAGRSGLSDKMSPGDIASLMQTDEVVFRVHFLDRIPAMRERYWRGPVFDTFDGRGWSTSMLAMQARSVTVEPRGEPLHYEMTLEPQGSRWLFGLDVPAPTQLPPDTTLDLLLAAQTVRERKQYQATAYTQYLLQPEMSPVERRSWLQLPPDFNPRSRELMQQWREQGLDDAAIVRKVLQMYRQENFSYTLQPPRLARDSVDDFLFSTRQGFCEHYSSSFTFLMRAAGIPARVVTGYQGGEKNEIGDYYVVHQYDAHAWSEVWLTGQGWVRIDPTAAVAPERVERGLSSALTLAGGLPGFLARQQNSGLRIALNMRWDWVNAKWNAWVLAYGPDLQADFLRNFGIEDWSDMILAMTVLITLATAVVSLLLMRQFIPAVPQDRALQLWRNAQRKLTKAGMHQRPDEGPCDFAERVIQERPMLTGAMTRVLSAYLKLRYLQAPDNALERELETAVSDLNRHAAE